MTIDELERDWEQYYIDIRVYFVNQKILFKGKLFLKEQFSICFRSDSGESLTFVPIDKDVNFHIYKCDSVNCCSARMPDRSWIKIGDFIKIPVNQ